jgi:hypothetical protein
VSSAGYSMPWKAQLLDGFACIDEIPNNWGSLLAQ